MSADPVRARKAAGGGAASANGDDAGKPKGQDKQRMLLAADAGHFSMIRALHLADAITCMNLFCGFMSITHSVKYAVQAASVGGFGGRYGNSNAAMWWALSFIPLGLFFDFFDGKVARWRGKSSLMGQELDSLADLVSFGVAPATAAYTLGVNTPVDHILLAFFVLCALCRLARFNVTVSELPKDVTGKSKYFEGFPAPTSLCIVGWMATWLHYGWTHDAVPGGLKAQGTLFEFHPAVAVFVLWGSLMILSGRFVLINGDERRGRASIEDRPKQQEQPTPYEQTGYTRN